MACVSECRAPGRAATGAASGSKPQRAQPGAEIQSRIERADYLQAQVHEAAGQPFNLGSPKQLGEILFERQGLPVFGELYETDADAL